MKDLVIGLIVILLEAIAFFFSGDVLILEDYPVLTTLVLILGALLIHVRFTIVDEGTDKLVTFLGSYWKTLLTKKGFKVNENGTIVRVKSGEKVPWKLPGGLRFVGLWPFFRIHINEIRWVDRNMKKREEETSWLLAADYVYGMRVEKAEDEDLLPVDVDMSVTAWLCNPSKAIFKIKDWYGAFVGRLTPYVRQFISTKPYRGLQKTDLETAIFQALVTDGIIDELKKRYGIHIRKIEVTNLDPGERHRDLTMQRLLGQMNAEQADEETAGRVMRMVAKILGLPTVNVTDDSGKVITEGLTEKLAGDPNLAQPPGLKERYDAALAWSKDQVTRDRAGDMGELRDIRVGNTRGTPLKDAGIAAFLSGVGAGGVLFGKAGNPGGGKPKKSKKKGRKSKDDDDDDEDEEVDEPGVSY